MNQNADTAIDLAEAGEPLDGALLTLIETIEALASAGTVADIALVVRSAARRISGADGVAFVLRDEEQCWYLDEDAIGPLWKGRRFPMEACISGWAMLNRKTAVIPDIYADDRIPHDAYRPTFVKSLVMTPVRPADPLAAIGAYWAQERQPTTAEVARLEVIARATAAALESARARASLQEALERRELLLHELDHRMKNTLAAAHSITRQTLRHADSAEAFADAFERRLMALSQAHELLTQGGWGRATMEQVLMAAVTPFSGEGGDRMSLFGPAMSLSPETAVDLHMAFHELAVNAAKYGALSQPGGRVSVTWDVGEDGRFRLTWQESDGPPVEMPTERGFGSRLIESGMSVRLGGKATLRFAPEGLVYKIDAPLSAGLAAG
ncbi:HWE histidine kinase domain-containing protein [Caulobacter segnis]|uniref:sensor histidine kinase n=1 Tax=Caulobacter segnis TaxID=88688 RepID=UPI0024107BCD|nr:HWE histidine kinase domain-containing protein [Caulobacter segnis]MDG2523605.1 HWE histidine kinase domain-containing protein [Caulobacter segnis]